MQNSCTGDQKDQQHGHQMIEASFHGNRCLAAVQHHVFPGQIIIWWPLFINTISNTQTTSACFLKISSLKYEGWLFIAAFCCLYLHSNRWELFHSTGSVDGLCGVAATSSNSGGPSLKVPSWSLVFVFGHFICCVSKIWCVVQMDRTAPLVGIS